MGGSLASHSDHPVSKAIATWTQSSGKWPDRFCLRRAAFGLAGRPTLILGNHRLIEERGLCNAEIEAHLNQAHETQAEPSPCWRSDQQVLAILPADTIRKVRGKQWPTCIVPVWSQ